MIQPMDLTGRSILVTGASSGIGRETARFLSQLGARLVLVGRNDAELALTAEGLEGTDHSVEPFDLTRLDEIGPWMKELSARIGSLYGLVHSAGIQHHVPLRYQTLEDLEATLEINLNAAIFLAKAFRQKGVSRAGSIVLISSVSGLRGTPSLAAYSASKGGIDALTRSLAMELARDGIRVNCVAPAVVLTAMVEKGQENLTPEQIRAVEAMHPLGLGQPRDVAYAIAFLLAPAARWITGTTLVTDGGYTAH